MEVTSKPSTSREASRQPPAPTHPTDRAPPSKRPKSEIIAPSSPSKSRTLYKRPASGLVDKEQEARRQASLLSYAEARAKASSHYNAAEDNDADFKYPPGSSGDSSARGLLEQIKNRMDQRAPKPSSFLQKAKQVQQSLLDKQQQKVQIQKAREEAEKRESMRSSGFADQHARFSRNSASQSVVKAEPTDPTQGAFTRAKARVDEYDDDTSEESDQDEWQNGRPITVEEWDELIAWNDREYEKETAPGDFRAEDIPVGPRHIPPNPDDPKWERMEPFSGHRLRERKVPHSTLREHFRGRYHITSCLLYALARPITMGIDGAPLNSSRNGDYEVPVNGDWIVISVIVEKSEIMVTKGFKADAPASRIDDDDPVLFKDASDANGKLRLDLEPGNSNAFETSRKPSSSSSTKPHQVDEDERIRQNINLSNRSRKFIILKLVDLSINGDSNWGHNQLQLIAYESDVVDTSVVLRNTNIRSEVSDALAATSTKKYINGSRGAFELLAQQSEGTVVAIMNPKVLRPFAPNAKSLDDKMFRISPRSAEDCLIIGQAADYKRCCAMKANGTRCGSFVDVKTRKQTQTMTCDYHLNRQMDSLARGRPEFATNATSRFGGAKGTETKVTSSFKSSNSYAKIALAKKLNSSFGNVGDGMDNNGGQVYTSSTSLPETKPSDPSSWKYDVNTRYGRGQTEKRSRLKKLKEEEKLAREIERRFGAPRVRKPVEADADGGREIQLPVLPNGSADLINAAYSTLEQRKQKAAEKRAADNAKKRKFTGVVAPTPSTSTPSETTKLQFCLPITTKRPSTNLLPITGLSNSTSSGKTSRTTLLSLASPSSTNTTQPSLKIRKSHRPKLRRPPTESGQSIKVVAGQLVHLDDFADEAWEDDLHPTNQTQPSTTDASSLSNRILQLNPQQPDSDSDLEII